MSTTTIPLGHLLPAFLQLIDPKKAHTTYRILTAEISEADAFPLADGLQLKCPRCYLDRGRTIVGVHVITCWLPHVSQDQPPAPGRWFFTGTTFDDLTLTATPSDSIRMEWGCRAHFWIRNGQVEVDG